MHVGNRWFEEKWVLMHLHFALKHKSVFSNVAANFDLSLYIIKIHLVNLNLATTFPNTFLGLFNFLMATSGKMQMHEDHFSNNLFSTYIQSRI